MRREIIWTLKHLRSLLNSYVRDVESFHKHPEDIAKIYSYMTNNY
ncbi:hypothetical protein LCGC14_1434780 [marine sediment metagenome]|uniref:Uncharacterized protein n=1 Tax=marine sediment metagenome TaxID=412755 RepID=A0A0F9K8R1_9ZZZZ